MQYYTAAEIIIHPFNTDSINIIIKGSWEALEHRETTTTTFAHTGKLKSSVMELQLVSMTNANFTLTFLPIFTITTVTLPEWFSKLGLLLCLLCSCKSSSVLYRWEQGQTLPLPRQKKVNEPEGYNIRLVMLCTVCRVEKHLNTFCLFPQSSLKQEALLLAVTTAASLEADRHCLVSATHTEPNQSESEDPCFVYWNLSTTLSPFSRHMHTHCVTTDKDYA